MPKSKKVKPFSLDSYLLNSGSHVPAVSNFEPWAFERPGHSSPSSEIASPKFTEGACPELVDGSKG